ncbi:DNA topoisomerase I [Candidatus Woesebacteria bacterium]|nr:DNA topoisomerase I [Candidatus Woesebacteria bacterium]
MNLIIVESPTKAKTLSRFLGKEYTVDSTMGHIQDLPKSKLGIDVEKNFAPDYILTPGKEEVVERLKKEAKDAKRVYLATDPDREGEAIAYHTFDSLAGGNASQPSKGTASKFQRIVFHEITEEAVKEALGHPRVIDNKLVDAQVARRVLDRLVGYKLSPLIWKKVRRGLSAGRVQSVAVRLVVERDRDIAKFKADEYWEIFADVKAKKTKGFTVELVKIAGKKAEVKDGKTAKKVVSDLNKAKYIVLSVDKKEVKRNPYPPFTTSTMTQSASSLYSWSAKRTMSVAQKLYEKGLITYHRTDSVHLATQAVDMARHFIQTKYSEKFLPEAPRVYKVKSKSAQEAHEAIRPTKADRIPGEFKTVGKFKEDASKLYALIWKRFVACQMATSIYDQTTINVEASKYLLRASGRIMKFEGWQAVNREIKSAKTQAVDGEQKLPEVKEKDSLQLIKVDPQQKFTEPPPKYNEASLIKTLEQLEIGRPSTYAPIISTIQARQYVEKTEGKLNSTTIGVAVSDFLVKHFPDVFDYQFTALMEGDLDKIAAGSKKWAPIIGQFWKPFSSKLKGVEEKAKRVKIEVEKTGDKCPDCKKGDQVIRVGRFGKFLSCSRFPDCSWKANYVETIEMKCLGCKKGEVVVKKTKTGRRFFGCSRYPDCDWASWKNPKQEEKKE